MHQSRPGGLLAPERQTSKTWLAKHALDESDHLGRLPPMNASDLHNHCRGLKTGTLTLEEARKLAGLFELKPMSRVICDLLTEIEHYDGDFLVHDGDLHIEGPLAVHELSCVVLIVRGRLTVDGCYSDADDPQTITLVEGDFNAKGVVTAGFLEVHGDANVVGPFLGDYNDCNARISGTLRCELFYPEEHFFEVGGFEAKVALGNVKHRVKGAKVTDVFEMDDPRLLQHFDRVLLRTVEEDGKVDVDGFADYGQVRKRVKAGIPLRAS